VTGNAAITLSRGRVVWEGGELKTERGTGQYVNRPAFASFWDAQNKRNALAEPTAVQR
jgi:dihydropyrimidinase